MEATKTSIWVGTIEGLDCADCAATLAKDVKKLGGVRSAELNFATSRLKIEYDPQLFDEKKIPSEIKKLGYRLARAGEYNRIVLLVEGMDCSDESSIVEKQLRRLAGVRNLQFNLIAQEVWVEYDAALLTPPAWQPAPSP